MRGKRGFLQVLPLILPYLLLTMFFLVFPLLALLKATFQDGISTWVRVLQSSVYLKGLGNSFLLAIWTALESSVIGAVLAMIWAKQLGKHHWFLSYVNFAANNGGISLAFAFVATLGTNGMITLLLKEMGISLYPGFELASIIGLHWVYLSFLIPFMVLIFLPAIGGIRSDWRQAAETLGASRWYYLRKVVFPLLMPAFLSSMALVFLQALGTYATAQAISNDRINLLPIQIGYLMQMSLFRQADATVLSFILLVLMIIVIFLYRSANRKIARWLR